MTRAAILAAALLCAGPAVAKEHRSQAVLHAFQATHPCPSTGNVLASILFGAASISNVAALVVFLRRRGRKND